MTITIDLTERTITGTTQNDGINWRCFGLLWSPRRQCWVWPDNRHPATITARANEIQRTIPDVEIVGQCDPTDVDRVAQAELAAARHDRQAQQAQAEADRLHAKANDMFNVIPVGQPIMVGHHSERRDRTHRQNAQATLARAVEADREAARHARLAEAATTVVRRLTLPTPTVDVRDVLQLGDVAVCDSKDGRTTRSNTVTKINRTTFAWAELGCSGTVKLDRITAVIRDGVTVLGSR